MYEIKQLKTQIFQENIYFIVNRKTRETIIVDPGIIEFETLDHFIQNEKLNPVAILNTHGHPDHIYLVNQLLIKYDIPFFLHENEKNYLPDYELLGKSFGLTDFAMPMEINYISDGTFNLAGFDLEILSTPGHTPGSICIKFGQHLISGDTLFEGSIGRVDLPGGSMKSMRKSIEILRNLDKSINIFPGHGDHTTLEKELKYNPYFS
jgi:glyoxylase-like metal-dependent hydrolase (beta-lactamase superfamily II)